MKKKIVLILGAGRIGSAIAYYLKHDRSQIYRPILVEIDEQAKKKALDREGFDVSREYLDDPSIESIARFLKQENVYAVINCLPYYETLKYAGLIISHGIHYLDVSEDVSNATALKQFGSHAKGVVIPHCGLAPGFSGIIANNMGEKAVKITVRVGALPLAVSNELMYIPTWNIDGIVNEYTAISPKTLNNSYTEVAERRPLEKYEILTINGKYYEAFTTTGGDGNLPFIYNDKAITYKSIRYVGHKKAVDDILQKDGKNGLKIALRNCGTTNQDVVIVYITGEYWAPQQNIITNYIKFFYNNDYHTAIQRTTALSTCAILDLIKEGDSGYKNVEQTPLKDFLNTSFGKLMMHDSKSR